MLSGADLTHVAFGDTREGMVDVLCRSCVIARFGEHTVNRLERGLSAGTSWTAMQRWMIEELAVNNGYEYADRSHCTENGHPFDDDSGFCAQCAEVTCVECGARVDR
jgi:hypothetical protein